MGNRPDRLWTVVKPTEKHSEQGHSRDPVPGYDLALPFLLPAAERKLSSFRFLSLLLLDLTDNYVNLWDIRCLDLCVHYRLD